MVSFKYIYIEAVHAMDVMLYVYLLIQAALMLI